MTAYWTLLIVPACLAVLAQVRELHGLRPLINRLFPVAILAIAVFVGLRHNVGADWDAYQLRIDRADEFAILDILFGRDPGYELLSWFSAQSGFGVYGVNLICSAIFLTGIGMLCARQPNRWLALVVAIPYLVVVVGMNYTRQSAALGLVMMAFCAASDRRLWPSVFLVLIATLFHRSAPIALPFVLLAVFRSHSLRLSGAVLAVLLLGVVVKADLSRFTSIYVERDTESSGALIRLALNFVPALLFVRFRSRMKQMMTPPEYELWWWVSIACLVAPLTLPVLPSSTLVDRAALYILPIQLVVLSRTPSLLSEKGAAVAGVIAYSAAVLGVWFSLSRYAAWWLPYQNILL